MIRTASEELHLAVLENEETQGENRKPTESYHIIHS